MPFNINPKNMTFTGTFEAVDFDRETILGVKDEPTHNAVDHPEHYAHGQYECIDVMEDVFGLAETQIFCVLNAFKYIWRCWRKNDEEDVKKAIWYLNKYVELEAKLNEME